MLNHHGALESVGANVQTELWLARSAPGDSLRRRECVVQTELGTGGRMCRVSAPSGGASLTAARAEWREIVQRELRRSLFQGHKQEH